MQATTDSASIHTSNSFSLTNYPGRGSGDDPYVVDWDEDDPKNPYNWSHTRKWLLTAQLAAGTLAVSFASSSYTGSLFQTQEDLRMSHEVAVLPITLYVLGFGLGPLLFAPLSEIYGRRIIFLWSFIPFTLFQLPCALAPNTAVLLLFRLLAGTFGSSPLSNAGAAIADIWVPGERGLATSLYSSGPWFGPIIGPLVGGYLTESPLGWRFNFWITFILASIVAVLGIFTMPETYAPVLVRRKTWSLRRQHPETFFISKYDIDRKESISAILATNLKRPFVFLLMEPIVSALSIYIALIYGALYATFVAYPIVFQQHRGWGPGEGGLAFLGTGLGIAIGNFFAPLNNRLYAKAAANSETGRAPPETRLKTGMLGGVLIPIGMFWFAWSTYPNIHYMVPIASGIPFGCGMLLVFLSVVSYLQDTYRNHCASALAATIVLRSMLGAVFPLFTAQIYNKVGDQWGASIFAFIALACMPLPCIFFIFGPRIRAQSRFANLIENKSATSSEARSPPSREAGERDVEKKV